jgi:hypothetical protein
MAKQKKGSKPNTSAPRAAVTPPEIDKAASAAAAFVAARGTGAAKAGDPARTRESASFKQLKQGLEQTGAASVSNLLDRSAPPGQLKSHVPFGSQGGNQKGHNQTIGSDAVRTGVPRRTGG